MSATQPPSGASTSPKPPASSMWLDQYSWCCPHPIHAPPDQHGRVWCRSCWAYCSYPDECLRVMARSSR